MDFELKLLSTITRHLPRIKGADYLANKIKDFYRRKRDRR